MTQLFLYDCYLVMRLYILNIKNCIFLFQAHVVSAFEQSLSNMTQRLQQLTATAEKKVRTIKNIIFIKK